MITITWTPPSLRNGSYNYRLRYSARQAFTNGENTPLTAPITLMGTQQSYNITDGLPYADYNFTIFAYNVKRGLLFKGSDTILPYQTIPIGELLLPMSRTDCIKM